MGARVVEIGERNMPTALAHKYPECFPQNFEAEILPKGIEDIELFVYRVCTNGIINKDSFLSTFEEIQLGKKPKLMNWTKQLKIPSTYSTSCDTSLNSIKNVLKCLKDYHPNPIIAKGTATFRYGPLQRTSDRTGKETTHVDWWLYADADPSGDFALCED